MPYQGILKSNVSSSDNKDADKASEIAELVTQLRRDFTGRDALYQKYDATIHGETEVRIPAAYDKTAMIVRTPMARHIVDTIVAALSVNAPTVQFQPTGFGQAPNENATRRERFFEASWLRQERDAHRRLFRLFMYSLVAKGEAVIKTVERSKSAWGPYREYGRKMLDELGRDDELDDDARDRTFLGKLEAYKRDKAPYPITSTDVLPETFYYMKGLDGLTLAVEVKDVPYLDTLSRFKMGLDIRGNVVPAAMGLPLPEWQNVMRGAGQTIKMLEVWTAAECNYVLLGPGQSSGARARDMAEGTIVSTLRNHGYGNPYTQTLDGPYFHAQGTTTAHRLPEKAGLGVLYGFLDLFPLLDSMMTIAHNNAIMTGFASFKKNRPPSEQAIRPRNPGGANAYGEDGDEGDEDEDVISPGYIYPDDIGPIEMPKAGVEFDKFITMIRGFMELALPSVVQGVMSGDESGYALNQAAHLARLSWDPLLDNAEFALSDRVGFESYLIENHIGETVYAHGEVQSKTNPRRSSASLLSIGPKELRGNHNYRVKLDPQTPSNRSLEVRTHDEMVKAGFESYADAIEALGGNWDEVNRQRLFEEFTGTDEVKARIFDRAMQKLGWKDAKELEATREQLALADAEATGGAAPGAGGDAQPVGGGMGAGPGAVIDPAMGNMPQQPTPQGSVSGVGPAGRAAIRQGMGGGNLAGDAALTGPPSRHMPLPGEG